MKASKVRIASLMTTKGELIKKTWTDVSFIRLRLVKITNGDIENRKWVSSMLYTMVSPSGTVVTKKDLRRSKISRTLPAQIMPSNNDSA
jgi:hypothetical protein